MPLDGEPAPLPPTDPLPEDLPDEPTPGAGMPVGAWLGRLGASGSLVVFGSAGGVVASFLPAVPHHLLIEITLGVFALFAYLGCVALAWLLYQRKRHPQRVGLSWALLGCAAFLALSALGLFFKFLGHASIGTYLNVLAAGAVAFGAFLKAKEERLF